MNRLKELRTKYDLSLRKLQEYTGIDFSRLAVIEKTDANVELKTLNRLSDFFKVSNTFLLGNDGFVYYFDKDQNNYIPYPYEQFKNVLNDEVVSFSIENGCINRVISSLGKERINNSLLQTQKYIETRIKTDEFLDYLSSLNSNDFEREKEKIILYFRLKEEKENNN